MRRKNVLEVQLIYEPGDVMPPSRIPADVCIASGIDVVP